MKIQNWIDGHCHLADARYDANELEQVILRSRAAHVQGWVQGGVSPQDWDRQLQIQNQYGRGIVTAFGLHPWWVSQCHPSDVEEALALLKNRVTDAQAIGELGLDFQPKFQQTASLALQRRAFEGQLEIAKQSEKPLILHIVKAHSEALETLKKWAPFPKGGIVHSFSASAEIAQEYLSLGFLISIGGSITQKGFQNLKKAVNCLPLEKIVVETDSPDQPPVFAGIPTQGLNEPANLVGIAKALAVFYKVDYQQVLSSSSENLKQLFGIFGM